MVFYLGSEVSKALGIPLETLHMWATKPEMPGPSFQALWSGKWIKLYTQDDVAAVRRVRDERVQKRPAMQVKGPGRPALWSLEEKAARNRRNQRAQYLRRRAQALRAVENDAEATELQERSDHIRAELARESRERRESVARRMF